METGGRRGEAQRLPEKRELERYAQDQLPMPPELNRDAKMRSRRERSGDNRRGASSEQRLTGRASRDEEDGARRSRGAMANAKGKTPKTPDYTQTPAVVER